MPAPAIAILIPTLPARRPLLARLMGRLGPQLAAANGRAVVLTLEDGGQSPVGAKRQRLVEACRTPWLAFVDDDDLVSWDYLPRVLAGVDSGADVVGFWLRHYVDGRLAGVSVHSLACGHWHTVPPAEPGGLARHYRTPNHLNPVRRELALDVGYRPMSVGEDADYSRRLFARHGAAMREWTVKRTLYLYLYRGGPPGPAAPAESHGPDGRLTRAGAEAAVRAGGSCVWNGRACKTLAELDAAV